MQGIKLIEEVRLIESLNQLFFFYKITHIVGKDETESGESLCLTQQRKIYIYM